MHELEEGAAPQAETTETPEVVAETADDTTAAPPADTQAQQQVADSAQLEQQQAKAPTPAGVHRLERARDLVEIAKGEAAELIEEGIQAFKDIDRRTMRVVHRFGQLFKQEV
jgi:hypothetical protein